MNFSFVSTYSRISAQWKFNEHPPGPLSDVWVHFPRYIVNLRPTPMEATAIDELKKTKILTNYGKPYAEEQLTSGPEQGR